MFLATDVGNDVGRKNIVRINLIARGYVEKPLTYANAYRWLAKGIGVIIRFFVWTIWKYLFMAMLIAIVGTTRFTLYLVKLIHTNKRLLCAVDGTIGGTVSYLWLFAHNMASSEQVVLVLFGGLCGAGLGVLNWVFVSKRVFHIEDKGRA